MAYKVLVTEKASEDLDGIVGYLAWELAKPQAALLLPDEIDAVYSRLAEIPLLYSLCVQPLLSRMGWRKAVVRGYLMLYKVDEKEKTVFVERFFSDLEVYIQKV